jgi:hypothetical protein
MGAIVEKNAKQRRDAVNKIREAVKAGNLMIEAGSSTGLR